MLTGINHLTLAVTDIGQSFDFYTRILELKPVMKSPISFYLDCQGLWLAFVQQEKVESRGYAHLAFFVTEAELGRLKRKLLAYGSVEWQANRTEGDSFYFTDPSGNKLELHATTLADRIEYGKTHWGSEVEWYV